MDDATYETRTFCGGLLAVSRMGVGRTPVAVVPGCWTLGMLDAEYGVNLSVISETDKEAEEIAFVTLEIICRFKNRVRAECGEFRVARVHDAGAALTKYILAGSPRHFSRSTNLALSRTLVNFIKSSPPWQTRKTQPLPWRRRTRPSPKTLLPCQPSQRSQGRNASESSGVCISVD